MKPYFLIQFDDIVLLSPINTFQPSFIAKKTVSMRELVLPELVMDIIQARETLSRFMDLDGYRLGIMDLIDKKKKYFFPVVVATKNPENLNLNIQRVFYYPGEEPADDEQLERKPLPKFYYMHSSYLPNVFEKTEADCDFCNTYFGYSYTGPIYAEEEFDGMSLCPKCIASGKFAKRHYASFQTDLEPELGVSAKAKKTVLEKTPGFNSKQDISWKVCCQKPCKYIGTEQSEDNEVETYVFKCVGCSAQYQIQAHL